MFLWQLNTKKLGDKVSETVSETMLVRVCQERSFFFITFLPVLTQLYLHRFPANQRVKFVNLKYIYLDDVYTPFSYLANFKPEVCEKYRQATKSLEQGRHTECLNFTHGLLKQNENLGFHHFLLFARARCLVSGDCVEKMKESHLAWNEAAASCEEADASLPSIRAKGELHFLLALLKVSPHIKFTEGLFLKQFILVSQNYSC